MAAVAAGAAGAGLRLVNEGGHALAANAPQDEILVAGDFRVDIPGSPVASANMFEVRFDPIVIDLVGLGMDLPTQHRLYGPGAPHFGNAAFRFGIKKNEPNDILPWVEEAVQGQNIRKNISVICLKRDGSPARTFNLIDCFPVSWDPGDYRTTSNIACESVTVKLGRVELG
jgi:phage tail-like protein